MELSRQLLIINRHLLAYYKRELEAAQVDLSLADMLLLSYLYRHAGCRQDDVAKAFLWDKAHVARHLQALEQRGLISREAHETDKRVKVIQPTALGRSYEDLIQGIQQGWSQQVCEGHAGDPDQLASLLSHLLDKAKNLAVGEAERT